MKSRYLAMVLGLMSSAAMADSQIGNVVQPDYSGATGTRAVSSAALEELHFNRDVFAGETVKTPTDGSTVIKFQDQTQIQVGHNSTIVLDSFVYDPQTATSNGSIAFSKGVFRFISGTANDKAVGLTTPTTTMAIRGTRVLINVGDDGSSDVGVVDGSVEVTPCGGGSPVTLTQGRPSASAPPATAPSTCPWPKCRWMPRSPAISMRRRPRRTDRPWPAIKAALLRAPWGEAPTRSAPAIPTATATRTSQAMISLSAQRGIR
jgi:hypothetical protein